MLLHRLGTTLAREANAPAWRVAKSQQFVAINSDAPGDPLYAQVASALRHRILVEEALSPGDVIPPERVLVGDFGVSRITLRRAIDVLVDEHLLVRRRGLGTFVAS